MKSTLKNNLEIKEKDIYFRTKIYIFGQFLCFIFLSQIYKLKNNWLLL